MRLATWITYTYALNKPAKVLAYSIAVREMSDKSVGTSILLMVFSSPPSPNLKTIYREASKQEMILVRSRHDFCHVLFRRRCSEVMRNDFYILTNLDMNQNPPNECNPLVSSIHNVRENIGLVARIVSRCASKHIDPFKLELLFRNFNSFNNTLQSFGQSH